MQPVTIGPANRTLQPRGMKSNKKKDFLSTVAVLFLVLALGTSHAEVVFSGLDDRQDANVRALSPLVTTSCDSARWRVERLFRDADKDIVNAMRALGYYEPKISKTLRWDADCWYAEFEIKAGEPIRLRVVDVEIIGSAANDASFLNRKTAIPPQPGDVFDHGQYTEFKLSLKRAATDAGFFEAAFESSKVVIDKEARAADLVMRMHSGEKYQFGDVSFTQGILRDRLLQGYTEIRAGEAYSAKSISDLYETLSGSGYFSSVAIETEPLDRDTKTVPVTVNLVPAKRRIYSVGAGFSTDLGPNSRLGHTNRRINDRGHQFESKLFGSTVRTEFNTAYRWPKRDPRYEWFSIVAGVQHEKTDTSEQDIFKLGFLRSKNVRSNWLQTRYVDYEYEDFVVADQKSTSQLVVFGTNWERAKGRVLSRATGGYRLNFDVRAASDSLGSDTSFIQTRIKAKWVHSLGERTRVLARVSLGMTAKDKLSELPASVRFFAGGDSSVRGYDFETLGPVDDDGDVIGGSNKFDASLEVDRLIRDQWAVAAFIDTGDAFDQTDLETNTGIGLGLRWYSPVGPIRIDIAHPLDNPDEDFRIHIGLGPDL
jgi:translocation and assembly module TamA